MERSGLASRARQEDGDAVVAANFLPAASSPSAKIAKYCLVRQGGASGNFFEIREESHAYLWRRDCRLGSGEEEARIRGIDEDWLL